MSFSFGKISKKNYDYLIGDEYKFKGSVHAGGQSYSGADIKIVVTLNKQFDAVVKREQQLQQQKIEEYQKLADDKDAELKTATAQLDSFNKSASQRITDSPKMGSPEWARLKGKVNRLQKEKKTALDVRDSVQGWVMPNSSRMAEENVPVTKVLAEAQTLSISVFRDKAPVRSLGSIYPKGFTRGPRQIGGSLVFTVFDKDVLYEFLAANPSDFDGNRNTSAVLDQLPPVDIIVAFASELGSVSRMALYGVEFMSSGQMMSIEDMMTENTVEYIARDFDPMTNVGVVDLEKSKVGQTLLWQSKSASDLIFEDDYDTVKGTVDPFERFKRRNTRFL
jgi:hypothetical protein